MSAWFAVSEETPTVYRAGERGAAEDATPPDWDLNSEHHATIGNELCQFMSSYNIDCSVVSYPGSHDFPSAGSAFAAALPWLAGKIGTPGVREIPMPGAPQGN
jgi:S-formylglutathione hydrolase FrmB